MIFNMVGGAGGGQTDGMFCWAKFTKETTSPALTTTGVTLSPNGNEFNITSSAGDAWASHLIHSPSLNTEGTDINVTHTIVGTAYPYFIGFSSKAETVHTAYDHCVYIVNGGTIQHIASNTVAGNYGTYAVGDVIRINLKDGKLTVYKNESFLFSVDYALESVVMNATFYYGNVNYGTIECSVVEEADRGYVLSDNLNAYPQDGYGEDGFYYKRLVDNIPWHEAGSYVWAKSDADGNLVEYVVSDNPSEFPEDGQGDDGYYYKLHDMAEKKIKYASGKATAMTTTISIRDLAFKPTAVFVYNDKVAGSYPAAAWGFADENGNLIKAWACSGASGSGGNTGTFEISDTGFKIQFANVIGSTSTCSWYAIGI